MQTQPNKTQIEILNEIKSINKKLSYLEEITGTEFAKILSLFEKNIKPTFGTSDSEVEIEPIIGTEDLLTPNDIFLLPLPMKQTALELIRFRIATADEIAKRTRRERAVESGYLNQLTKMNYSRKIRIGRKIYFSIGDRQELEPFMYIKKEWREIMIMLLRLSPIEIENYHFNLNKLKSNSFTNLISKELDSIENLTGILNDIAMNYDFLDSQIENSNENYTFKRKNWINLTVL